MATQLLDMEAMTKPLLSCGARVVIETEAEIE